MNKWLTGIMLIVCFSLFLYRAFVSLDPDFGWHLRMGEIIIHSGIPKTDPFSYTMPNYPFVDHEWLTNFFIASIYPYIGKIGLAIIFSLFPLVALLITVKSFWREPYRSLFLLSTTIFSLFSGIRVQVITWFFFALLLLIINNQIYWRRFRWFLPVLFLLWVNFHGGFAVGIVTLGIVMVVDLYERKSSYFLNPKSYIFILLLCLLATFLNPYGYRIWWEIWMQFSDTSLHWTVSEWIPTLANPMEISIWFFLFFSLTFVLIYRKKFIGKEIILYICFFIFGQTSVRNVPLWILVALPVLIKGFDFFIDKAKKYRFGEQRARVLLKGFTIFVLLVVTVQTWRLYRNNLSESSFYPKNAVQFLHNHLPSGNIFSSYDWGGYLIWKLPKKKVFIDGRMPSWRWKAPSVKESDYAFRDYQNIGSGKLPWKTVINKYHITMVFLPVSIEKKERKKSYWLRFLENPDIVFYGKKENNTISIPEALKELGFIKIYGDTIAVIYAKK